MIRKSLLLLSCLAALFLLGACGSAPAAESGALTVPLADLTGDVQFFDGSINGTALQVIARVDEDGTPRLAYNTCQVCVGSPYAYFELVNGYLVCQNCGNAFPPESVGRVSGSCNPMPVTDYEVTDSAVVISEETLASVEPLFKNWKAIK